MVSPGHRGPDVLCSDHRVGSGLFGMILYYSSPAIKKDFDNSGGFPLKTIMNCSRVRRFLWFNRDCGNGSGFKFFLTVGGPID